MARPRVFVSSTYYDLKHIRSSLDGFIESLGFDSILFEKGDIPFLHDVALDSSCYAEVGNADIFVLILGGRYGSSASDEETVPSEDVLEKYNSITKMEYMAAVERDIPIFILVESSVYSEYQTYRSNKGNDSVRYAHVDDPQVFLLLEVILSQHRNNPIHPFERFSEIESWLREQWAGLFREYLKRNSGQKQLKAMAEQIERLQQANETLREYLSAIAETVVPDEADKVKVAEEERAKERRKRRFFDNDFVAMIGASGIDSEELYSIFADPGYSSLEEFVEAFPSNAKAYVLHYLLSNHRSFEELNHAREIAGCNSVFSNTEYLEHLRQRFGVQADGSPVP